MKTFVKIIVLIFVVATAGAAFVWSGVYNVSALNPHWDATLLVLEETRDQSIKRHSEGISAPSLADPKLVASAFPDFHEACRLCHGAPGYAVADFAQGLYPGPPSLTSEDLQGEWNEAELFWIVKNGLKMTGMPAFGPTHSDEEIWGIVAFVKHLPRMKEQEYKAMAQSAEGRGELGASPQAPAQEGQ